MLTAELVHARRQKDALKLVPLGSRAEDALAIAEALVALAEDHVGRTREELEEAWRAIEVSARDEKLKSGLAKLVEDQLEFEVATEIDPETLRRDVFVRAAAARREGGFEREAVLSEIAEKHASTPEAIERGLYADLRAANVLARPSAHGSIVRGGAKAIVEGYDLAQAQAILLRATRVVVTLEKADPASLRAVLRKLKFHRLLCSAHREDKGGVRIEIDGPFSLFASVTKYGLALAIALPSLLAAGKAKIEADVRWGKERLPLRFALDGELVRASAEREPEPPDELRALMARYGEGEGAWRAERAHELLDLPGLGVVVPDLVMTRRKDGARVLVELMGYWSRDAVWRRVELAEKGLPSPVIFCVSERLRVSEAVLPEGSSAALLVYKGVITASALEAKLDAVLKGRTTAL